MRSIAHRDCMGIIVGERYVPMHLLRLSVHGLHDGPLLHLIAAGRFCVEIVKRTFFAGIKYIHVRRPQSDDTKDACRFCKIACADG